MYNNRSSMGRAGSTIYKLTLMNIIIFMDSMVKDQNRNVS